MVKTIRDMETWLKEQGLSRSEATKIAGALKVPIAEILKRNEMLRLQKQKGETDLEKAERAAKEESLLNNGRVRLSTFNALQRERERQAKRDRDDPLVILQPRNEKEALLNKLETDRREREKREEIEEIIAQRPK